MAPQTSSNIAEMETCISRWVARSAKLVGIAALAALVASSGGVANATENSPQMAREQHACAVVMGLHEPGDLYDTCIRSLNKSLSQFDQARLVPIDRSGCAERGFTPGARAFAVCVVTAEQTAGNVGSYDASLPVR
jgi:hypothetical protein